MGDVNLALDPIVVEIMRRQGDRTLTEYAKVLGVWPSTLSRAYRGKKRVGEVLKTNACAVYPELRELMGAGGRMIITRPTTRGPRGPRTGSTGT